MAVCNTYHLRIFGRAEARPSRKIVVKGLWVVFWRVMLLHDRMVEGQILLIRKSASVEKTMCKDLPQRKIPVHHCVHNDDEKPVIVFVTVCTDKRKNILCSSSAHKLLVKAWQAANSWLVGRYVIMPDHIHLFCSPDSSFSVSLDKWVQYWKAIVTRDWSSFEEKPLWQKSFWDTQLRNNDRYDEKWEYVLENPVRAGLCSISDDWPWQGELNILEW